MRSSYDWFPSSGTMWRASPSHVMKPYLHLWPPYPPWWMACLAPPALSHPAWLGLPWLAPLNLALLSPLTASGTPSHWLQRGCLTETWALLAEAGQSPQTTNAHTHNLLIHEMPSSHLVFTKWLWPYDDKSMRIEVLPSCRMKTWVSLSSLSFAQTLFYPPNVTSLYTWPDEL